MEEGVGRATSKNNCSPGTVALRPSKTIEWLETYVTSGNNTITILPEKNTVISKHWTDSVIHYWPGVHNRIWGLKHRLFFLSSKLVVSAVVHGLHAWLMRLNQHTDWCSCQFVEIVSLLTKPREMPYCPFYTRAWVGILTAAFNYSSQQLLGRPCPIDSIEPIHSDDGAAWLALHHQYASYLNLDEPRIIAQYDLPDITRFWTRGWIPPPTNFISFIFFCCFDNIVCIRSLRCMAFDIETIICDAGGIQ